MDDPSLKGKPVIVGGSEERGVVSSASYEARSFGVHSAQPIAAAMRFCPHGIFLKVRMERYKEVSERIFDIFHRFTPLVEPLSLDEAFLDVTGSVRLFGTAEEIAKKIKHQVKVSHLTVLAVFTGIVISLFEFLCTGQVYLPTIVYMTGVSEHQSEATLFLIFYNIMFILPLIIIFSSVYYGAGSDRLQDTLDKRRALIKFLTAIMFLVLAVVMFYLSAEIYGYSMVQTVMILAISIALFILLTLIMVYLSILRRIEEKESGSATTKKERVKRKSKT